MIVQHLILWGAIIMALALLCLPFLFGRRKRQVDSRLEQYQAIAYALLDKDLPLAREGFKSIIRADTEDIAAYLRLARVLREEGDRERAVAIYRTVLARQISDRQMKLQALVSLTEDLYYLKRTEEARSAALELKALAKKHPLIWQIELSDSLAHQDWSRALKALDQLDHADRGYSGVKPNQARTYIARQKASAGQTREGIKILEDVIRNDPNYGPARLLLGDLLMDQEKYQKAIEAWQRLLKKYPAMTPFAHGRLEKAYFELGRFGELGVMYEELASDMSDTDPSTQLARVRLALKRGEPADGLQIVEDLIERDPANDNARIWLVYLMLESGRESEAHGLLKEMAENRLLSPQSSSCANCGSNYTPETVRCPGCRNWLPNPCDASADLSRQV